MELNRKQKQQVATALERRMKSTISPTPFHEAVVLLAKQMQTADAIYPTETYKDLIITYSKLLAEIVGDETEISGVMGKCSVGTHGFERNRSDFIGFIADYVLDEVPEADIDEMIAETKDVYPHFEVQRMQGIERALVIVPPLETELDASDIAVDGSSISAERFPRN